MTYEIKWAWDWIDLSASQSAQPGCLLLWPSVLCTANNCTKAEVSVIKATVKLSFIQPCEDKNKTEHPLSHMLLAKNMSKCKEVITSLLGKIKIGKPLENPKEILK